MLADGQTLKDLMAMFPREGRVEWLGLRSDRRGAVLACERALLVTARGLEGDHRTRRSRPGGRRQVTLVQAEHLEVIARLCGMERLDPASLRRNIVVAGVNLLALHDRRFRLGEALLEGTGHCHPCSRMEQALGPGGYNAVRGHGGITARVLEGGWLRTGDALQPLPAAAGEIEPSLSAD